MAIVGSERPELHLAGLRDRFAAQAVDATFCFLVFWHVSRAAADRYGGSTVSTDFFEIQATASFVATVVFAGGALLYFFVMEWLAGGTAGKLLCGLSVRTTAGERCGATAALARNFVRPLDSVPLSIPGLASMLLSSSRQRLGDRVAGTVVVKTAQQSKEVLDFALASWQQRAQAAIVDLAALACFTAAFLFATGAVSSRPALMVHLLPFPCAVLAILIVAYFVILESATGATIGKSVLKLRVLAADGTRCSFATALIRAISKPADWLSGGIPALLMMRFSKRRQCLGDMLAGSMVVHCDAANRSGRWAAAGFLAATGLLVSWPLLAPVAHRAASMIPFHYLSEDGRRAPGGFASGGARAPHEPTATHPYPAAR